MRGASAAGIGIAAMENLSAPWVRTGSTTSVEEDVGNAEESEPPMRLLSFLQNRTGQLNFVNNSDEPSFRSPERGNAISGRLAEDDRGG